MSLRPGPRRSLDSMRHDIEEIDRAIVLLVAARVEAAGTAIRFRLEGGAEITDSGQESKVLARARGWADQAGLSPILVETIFQAMLEAGKERVARETGGPCGVLAPPAQIGGQRTASPRSHRRAAAQLTESTVA